MEEIKEGDIVRIKQTKETGVVELIVESESQTTYYINTCGLLMFRARREWLEPIRTHEQK